MAKVLYMVIPCYNEEAVIEETVAQLKKIYELMLNEELIDVRSRVIFVNDGSVDKTWEIINRIHKENVMFGGINLSRNCGHQNALLAGLVTVVDDCDMAISMDADLQDDVNVIPDMVRQYNAGYDVVYGVRDRRNTDTFFKRTTALSFYRIMKYMGVETIYNHADFRLMSKRALKGLAEFGEVNLFLRGIVPMLGYPATKVYYDRKERFAGESKYTLKKMIAFAIEGITSLSVRPMRMITNLGFFVFFMSIIILIYSLVRHYMGATIVGWTTTVSSIWAIGGLILLSQGIIGEYTGKIYLETKARPRFIVEQYMNISGMEKEE